MGLIEANYNFKTGNIEDLVDVGFGIYPFVSEYADRYGDLIGPHWSFPVIITNFNYLEECYNRIEEGVKKTVEAVKDTIDKGLYNLSRAILDEIFKKNMRDKIILTGFIIMRGKNINPEKMKKAESHSLTHARL